jgi:IS4 transposase
MELAAIDVANLYRNRWQIEVFFKWMKQNLTIKKLWGHSQNAVMTQLWVSICTYLIVAMIKSQLKSPYSITEVATLLSVSALEKISLQELLTSPNPTLIHTQNVKELTLFDIS